MKYDCAGILSCLALAIISAAFAGIAIDFPLLHALLLMVSIFCWQVAAYSYYEMWRSSLIYKMGMTFTLSGNYETGGWQEWSQTWIKDEYSNGQFVIVCDRELGIDTVHYPRCPKAIDIRERCVCRYIDKEIIINGRLYK